MTEEGINELERFHRLNELTVKPYKAEIINSLQTDDPQVIGSVQREIDDVYAHCTDVENVDFLKYLPQLKKLNISYCGTEDISPVALMANLEELDISFTKVSDISLLKGLSNLKRLNISGIPCDDLDPLTAIDSLEYVKLSPETDSKAIEALQNKGVKVEIYSPINKN